MMGIRYYVDGCHSLDLKCTEDFTLPTWCLLAGGPPESGGLVGGLVIGGMSLKGPTDTALSSRVFSFWQP